MGEIMKNIAPGLVAIPDNPIPPTATVYDVVTRDKLHLRAAHWLPEGEAERGIVCILQGRGEFIEKYFETIAELRQRGFHVVAFDWRGQGGSQRLLKQGSKNPIHKGHIRHFGLYQHDLDAVIEQVIEKLPPLPRFALGHSMGAAIALVRSANPQNKKDFSRIVALSPMLALAPSISPSFASAVIRMGASLGLSRLFIPGGKRAVTVMRPFEGNRLTSDPVRFHRIRAIIEHAPWLAVGAPTVGWLAAAFKLMSTLAKPGFALSVATPTLVIAAGNDRIVSTPVIEKFSARLKAGNALVLPYARHEILVENDDIRALFWAAFDAFIPGNGLLDDAASQKLRLAILY